MTGAEEGKLRKLGSTMCQGPLLFEENAKYNAMYRGLINNDPFHAMAFILALSPKKSGLLVNSQ